MSADAIPPAPGGADAAPPAPSPEGISRRRALGRLAVLPVLPAAAQLAPVAQALDAAAAPAAPALPASDTSPDGIPATPRFFTAAEFRTVRVLADDIIPKDERSGAASDAGVPAWIDWTLMDQPGRQVGIRGGLAWLDREARRRFGQPYAALATAQRHAILDDIAYPRRAPKRFAQGVAFFNRMRDLVAAGFYSSKLGYQDLRFTGAHPVGGWDGVPDAVLRQLGVSYEEWGR